MAETQSEMFGEIMKDKTPPKLCPVGLQSSAGLPVDKNSSTEAEVLQRSSSSSTEAPSTPAARYQTLMRVFSRGSRPSDEEARLALLSSSTGGASTGMQQSTAPSSLLPRPDAMKQNSRPAACQSSLQTRIVRRLAWSAAVLQRRSKSCSALQHTPGRRSSSSIDQQQTSLLQHSLRSQSAQPVLRQWHSTPGPSSAQQATPACANGTTAAPALFSSSTAAQAGMQLPPKQQQQQQLALQQEGQQAVSGHPRGCCVVAAAAVPQPATPIPQQHVSPQTLLRDSPEHTTAAAGHTLASIKQQQQPPAGAGTRPRAATQEITPYEEPCRSGHHSSQPSPRQRPARSASPDTDSDTRSTAGTTYPECLFLPAGLSSSSSFTTTLHNSSTGQKVAVVRVGCAITAVFIKEQSGEIWECAPDQIVFPSSASANKGQPGATAPNAPHLVAATTAAAAAAARPGQPLSSEAAHRLYLHLNTSSSSGSGSSAGWRQSWGGSQQGARSCGGGSQAKGRLHSGGGGSNDGSCRSMSISTMCSTHGSIDVSSCTGAHQPLAACLQDGTHAAPACTCCSDASPAGSRHPKPRFSLLGCVRRLVAQWQQQRAARQQRRAAVYVQGLDDAAHQAMRVAGCQSFVLPHHWPDRAKQQAREQRRLRVLLTAYRG